MAVTTEIIGGLLVAVSPPRASMIALDRDEALVVYDAIGEWLGLESKPVVAAWTDGYDQERSEMETENVILAAIHDAIESGQA